MARPRRIEYEGACYHVFLRGRIMKKIYNITIAIAFIFCCSAISIADDWKDESGKRQPPKPRGLQTPRLLPVFLQGIPQPQGLL